MRSFVPPAAPASPASREPSAPGPRESRGPRVLACRACLRSRASARSSPARRAASARRSPGCSPPRASTLVLTARRQARARPGRRRVHRARRDASRSSPPISASPAHAPRCGPPPPPPARSTSSSTTPGSATSARSSEADWRATPSCSSSTSRRSSSCRAGSSTRAPASPSARTSSTSRRSPRTSRCRTSRCTRRRRRSSATSPRRCTTSSRGTPLSATCICPGGTRTEFHAQAGAGDYSWLANRSMMSAEAVARITIRAMRKGKRTVIPGVLNKLSCWSVRLVAAPVRVVDVGARARQARGGALPSRSGAASTCSVRAPWRRKKTPLWDAHKALGARLIDFGGWDMPVPVPGRDDQGAQGRARGRRPVRRLAHGRGLPARPARRARSSSS